MEFNATFIVAFVSFIIFIVIMNQILYKPINNIVEKRKKLIDENYSLAYENSEKSKAILQDRIDKINNARNNVREKRALALDNARAKKAQAQNNAKSEVKLKIKENIDALNNDKEQAINVLKADIINLAQVISDKFIETPERITEVDTETIEKIMQE